jgi:prefoldin subunit 5
MRQKSNEERLRELELQANVLNTQLASLTEGTDAYNAVREQLEALHESLEKVYEAMMVAI